MSCPKCGAPGLMGIDTLCVNCTDPIIFTSPTNYTFDGDDFIQCGACDHVNELGDPRAVVDDDPLNMLWRCPDCGAVFDLAV